MRDGKLMGAGECRGAFGWFALPRLLMPWSNPAGCPSERWVPSETAISPHLSFDWGSIG